jgi:nitrogen-specific signal transduction histidine kinase
MIDTALMAAILDSLKDPVLVADTEHVTRYMNKAAIAYDEEGKDLLGRSLLALLQGENDVLVIASAAKQYP